MIVFLLILLAVLAASWLVFVVGLGWIVLLVIALLIPAQVLVMWLLDIPLDA